MPRRERPEQRRRRVARERTERTRALLNPTIFEVFMRPPCGTGRITLAQFHRALLLLRGYEAKGGA